MILSNGIYFTVHKYVNQFMTDYMTKIEHIPIVRNNYPLFEKFKKSSQSFRDSYWQDIGLLKMDMVTVNEQGNRFVQCVIEFLLQIIEYFFSEKDSSPDNLLLPFVIVNMKMWCVDYLPIKLVKLYFISTKVKLSCQNHWEE